MPPEPTELYLRCVLMSKNLVEVVNVPWLQKAGGGSLKSRRGLTVASPLPECCKADYFIRNVAIPILMLDIISKSSMKTLSAWKAVQTVQLSVSQ